MTGIDTLFPILRFVALVAPAIAILMQLMENAGESDSPAFRFLEIAIVVIFAGAIIILSQLLVQIEDSTTQFGVFLIFSSLILLAMGIAWRAVPFTDDLVLSINSAADLVYYTKEIIGRLIAFSIIFFPAIVFYVYFENISSTYLEIGNIAEMNVVSTHLIFSVVLFIFAFRFILYLLNTGHLTEYTIQEVLYESVVATIAGYIVVLVFLLPPFILAHLLVNIPLEILDIEITNTLFTLAYVWVVLMVLMIYGLDLWAEKNDYSRFAVDD